MRIIKVNVSNLTLTANKFTDIAVSSDPVSEYMAFPAVFFNTANTAVIATGVAIYNSGTITVFANAAVNSGRIFSVMTVGG